MFLFDDVVRAQQERLRNREAEGLGGLQVDNQLDLGRLLDRKIARPPGRARLAMRPRPTGSPTNVKTIGVWAVAFLAAGAASAPWVTRTSTFSPTSSAARVGSLSFFPAADRHSMRRFRP